MAESKKTESAPVAPAVVEMANPITDVLPIAGTGEGNLMAPVAAFGWVTLGRVRVGLAREVTMVTVPARVLGTKKAQQRPRTSYRTLDSKKGGCDDFAWTTDVHTVKIDAAAAGLFDSDGNVHVPASVTVEIDGWGEGAKSTTMATLYRHHTGRTDSEGHPIYRWETDTASESSHLVTDDGRIFAADVVVAASSRALYVRANVKR